jgi:hypothetical protein
LIITDILTVLLLMNSYFVIILNDMIGCVLKTLFRIFIGCIIAYCFVMKNKSEITPLWFKDWCFLSERILLLTINWLIIQDFSSLVTLNVISNKNLYMYYKFCCWNKELIMISYLIITSGLLNIPWKVSFHYLFRYTYYFTKSWL